MMLAYGQSLSHDHQGVRPFSPDHREAAGSVGPAVTRVQVYCMTIKQCLDVHSRPHPRSTALMEVMTYTYMLYLRSVEVGQAAYMG